MTKEEHEKYVDMRNACYRKRSEKNKSINYFTGFDDGFEKAKKQFTELEKENAELKEANRVLLEAKDINDKIDWKALADKVAVTKKLTEAKEILQMFLDVDNNAEMLEAQMKASRFIKEYEISEDRLCEYCEQYKSCPDGKRCRTCDNGSKWKRSKEND